MEGDGTWIELVANMFTFLIILLLIYLCFDWRYLKGRCWKWVVRRLRGCLRCCKATPVGGRMCACCPDPPEEEDMAPDAISVASVWSIPFSWSETPPPYEVAVDMPRPPPEELEEPAEPYTPQTLAVLEETVLPMEALSDHSQGYTNQSYVDTEDEGIGGEAESLSNVSIDSALPSYVEAVEILARQISATSREDESGMSPGQVSFTVGQEEGAAADPPCPTPGTSQQPERVHTHALPTTGPTPVEDATGPTPVEDGMVPLSRPPSYNALTRPPSYSTIPHMPDAIRRRDGTRRRAEHSRAPSLDTVPAIQVLDTDGGTPAPFTPGHARHSSVV